MNSKMELEVALRGWRYAAPLAECVAELEEALQAGAKVKVRAPWGSAEGNAKSLAELAQVIGRAARPNGKDRLPEWFEVEMEVRGGGRIVECTAAFERAFTEISKAPPLAARPGRRLRLGVGYYDPPNWFPTYLPLDPDLPGSDFAAREEVARAVWDLLPELSKRARAARLEKWWVAVFAWRERDNRWGLEDDAPPKRR